MATKSFTVKIGADTSDFIKGLKKADKAIKNTEKEGKELQQGLKIEFDGSRFARAQQLAQQALAKTEEKAQAIREQLQYLEKSGGVNTEGYQKLQIELVKTENKAVLLKRQLNEVDQMKFTNAAKGIDNIGNGLTKAGNATKGLSLAAAGAIAAVGALTVSAVKDAAELDDMAQQAEISAEAMQKWKYVAMQTGVESNELSKAIVKARAAYADLSTGQNNAQTQALSTLGIMANQYSSNEELFDATIRSLSSIGNETERVALANEIFGDKIATVLVPMLNAGSGAVDELINEFKDVGYISNETITKLASFDDELNIMKTQLSNAKTELAVAFLPILKTLADFISNSVVPAIQKFAEWFSNLPKPLTDTILALTGLLAILSPVLLIGGKLFTLVGSFIKGIPQLSKVLSALGTTTGRTLIGVAAFATALKLIFDVIDNWGNMGTIEKVVSILGILTIVALGAAIALGAFHSAWSLGLAVAGIIAGIVAVTAAVNSAKANIEADIPDFNAPSISGGSDGQLSSGTAASPNYNVDTSYGTGTTGTSNVDNSQNTYNIEIQSNEYMNADQLVDVVSKKLTLKLQSRS